MVGIYKIICLTDGRVYVGQSKNIETRIKDHIIRLNAKNHVNSRLQEAWDQYGGDKFAFSVLEECDESQEVRNEKEIYWIKELDANNPKKGFNIASGGTHGYSLYSLPENQRREIYKKISKYRAEHFTGENAPNYGIKMSEEQKQKIRESLSGKRHPFFGKKRPGHSKLMSGSGNSRAKKVICVNTGEVFSCAKHAGEKYKTTNSNILKCCKGRQQYAGMCNGQRLVWRYI